MMGSGYKPGPLGGGHSISGQEFYHGLWKRQEGMTEGGITSILVLFVCPLCFLAHSSKVIEKNPHCTTQADALTALFKSFAIISVSTLGSAEMKVEHGIEGQQKQR